MPGPWSWTVGTYVDRAGPKSVRSEHHLSRQNLPLLLGGVTGATDHQVQAGCRQNYDARDDPVPELRYPHQDQTAGQHAQDQHTDQAAENRAASTEHPDAADDHAADHLQLEAVAAVERRVGQPTELKRGGERDQPAGHDETGPLDAPC